jgi:ketosteroid isomerase-like protein
MPSPAAVRRFVSLVEAGEFVRAMEEFYADDASAQENAKPPRMGKAALIAHERGVLATMKRMFAHPARSVVVDGDTVAIRWIFDMTDAAGVTRRLDEVALQEWRGDRMVRERFFYDPASIVVVTSDGLAPE